MNLLSLWPGEPRQNLDRRTRIPEPPNFLVLQVSQRCNLRCQHCDFWKRNDSDKANYLSWARKTEIMQGFAAPVF